MASAEIAFERSAVALESTRGTAITTPTHSFPWPIIINPERVRAKPDDASGTLVRNHRVKTTQVNAGWESEGTIDTDYIPLILQMISKGSITPTTPSGATSARLWTATPTVSSDDLKAATLWAGDPNLTTVRRAAFGMAEEFTVEADVGSEDGASGKLSGFCYYPTNVSAPTYPAALTTGDILIPASMQLWIDTGSAIGTTEITGRFLKTSWTIPTGATKKRYAAGPTGGLNFTKAGRGKRAAKAELTLELNDTSLAAEYASFEADTTVKVRIRLNGGFIETASTVDLYHYLQLDIYGKAEDFGWEEVEGVNRAFKVSIESTYDSTLGADFSLSSQNVRATV
jgi:hypothetical protein